MPMRAGSIPAWAGETVGISQESLGGAVYPRVGGGNQGFILSLGLPPGLSPRGRGKPEYGGNELLLCGSIPAWAGETNLRAAITAQTKVYPRVGGGNAQTLL